MKRVTTLLAALCLIACTACADDTDRTMDATDLVHRIVQSLLDGKGQVTFPVADQVFAIDNGERLSRADLQNAWLQIARQATNTPVTSAQFFLDMDLRLDSPLNHKRLMGNKRLLESYTPQDGDLYCDASGVKDGSVSVIAYPKAFIYIIRKIEGIWTLIGIGG